MAPALLMAVGAHFLLSVPDGRLTTRARVVSVGLAYAAGLGFGLWAWFGPGRMTDPAAVVGWMVAVAVGLLGAARRYRTAPGVDRQRLQWMAAGAVSALEFGLVVVGLFVLVRWPVHPWAIAAGGTVLVSVGVAVATFRRLLDASDRILVWLLTATGLSAVVLAVYILVILGFGHEPGPGDRQVLGLSILAAAVVALGASVSHQRVERFAQRLVYGTDDVPDDVVKTFSTRLTRAVSMDELLLQLTESLHKSMVLTSAEVFTGSSEVLERSASIPDRGPGRLHIGPQEQPVVARAGVSGNAWTSVWLPAVIAGRDHAQLRVCPITYGGELLGLVVVERPTTEPPFSEQEDLVLTELSRQVGLALHNVNLDSALQSTLDEVRRQAAELRASRTRIVAAADAERRRVERDLHDGAQQHLVALAVNVRLVKDLVLEDPEAAALALDEIAVEVKATVQELRDLAHGIYPPLLMDNGLPEALRAVASRSPLDVTTAWTVWAASLPTSRRRCTSAASRPCRTRPSTPPGPMWRWRCGKRRGAAVHGLRRRARVRRRAGTGRARLHEHERPSRCHRGRGPVGLGAGCGIDGAGLDSDHLNAATRHAATRPGRAGAAGAAGAAGSGGSGGQELDGLPFGPDTR